MGGQHHTGPWSNEDQKLVNLCPGESKVEGCRWEGQNLQLKENQRLKKKKKKKKKDEEKKNKKKKKEEEEEEKMK